MTINYDTHRRPLLFISLVALVLSLAACDELQRDTNPVSSIKLDGNKDFSSEFINEVFKKMPVDIYFEADQRNPSKGTGSYTRASENRINFTYTVKTEKKNQSRLEITESEIGKQPYQIHIKEIDEDTVAIKRNGDNYNAWIIYRSN
ncbi:MAG: hypothetical protein AAGI37_11735 [Planctomycetota bacterium]